MQATESERLMTRAEVEERFGISRRHLEQLAYQGGGPTMVKIGNRGVRYRPQDVRDWIEARTVAHTSAPVEPAPQRRGAVANGGRRG